MFRELFCLTVLVGVAFGQWDPHYATDRYGIVHLFEWHWGTIADECENFLGPNKIGGVQISPPNENRIVSSRPWWERYQPISYILGTRSGDRNAFIDMVNRCNAVGVRIYPDVVINHMCGEGGSGTGTAGSGFNANLGTTTFSGVPYSANDFNYMHNKCHTGSGQIENYGDADQVRNCMLVGLLDLDQGTDYVRGKIMGFMNDLIDIGVAGFRVDACKHMWPGDLDVIFGGLHNLRSDVFGAGKRAFMFSEVIDQGGEPITAGEYTGFGTVTEFKYGINLGNNKNSLHHLGNFGESWGMLAGTSALVFLNNHDNQRGHGGGGSLVTFENPYDLKILTAFMLAWPYGTPRVMSSYYFSNSDEGPPGYQRSVESDGSCGNGWVCEHRWRQIKNMFAFGEAVQGTPVENWWTNDNNQIAFSRGNKGFLAINKAGYGMNENLYTGLPDGSYCNVIEGDYYDGKCAGPCITVSGGSAQINIGTSGEPMVAIYTEAMTSECNVGGGGGAGTGTGGGGGGNVVTTCTDCTCPDSEKVDCGELASTESSCTASGCLWCPAEDGSTAPWCFYQASETSTSEPDNGGGNTGGTSECTDCSCPSASKTDCGFMGIDESGCTANGCLWCPAEGTGDPWCFHSSGSTGGGGGGGGSCAVSESSRQECGYYGIQQAECESNGCCWAESNTNGVPWCYNQA